MHGISLLDFTPCFKVPYILQTIKSQSDFGLYYICKNTVLLVCKHNRFKVGSGLQSLISYKLSFFSILRIS